MVVVEAETETPESVVSEWLSLFRPFRAVKNVVAIENIR